MRLKGEEEKAKLEAKAEEIRAERDAGLQECEDLKLQIHLLEDRNDSIQNQLQETNRKLKESKYSRAQNFNLTNFKNLHVKNLFLAENSVENLRKELTDVRRQLADSNFEKDKYCSTNKDLREHIKRTEGEKRETSRALEEAFQKIACKYHG